MICVCLFFWEFFNEILRDESHEWLKRKLLYEEFGRYLVLFWSCWGCVSETLAFFPYKKILSCANSSRSIELTPWSWTKAFRIVTNLRIIWMHFCGRDFPVRGMRAFVILSWRPPLFFPAGAPKWFTSKYSISFVVRITNSKSFSYVWMLLPLSLKSVWVLRTLRTGRTWSTYRNCCCSNTMISDFVSGTKTKDMIVIYAFVFESLRGHNVVKVLKNKKPVSI